MIPGTAIKRCCQMDPTFAVQGRPAGGWHDWNIVALCVVTNCLSYRYCRVCGIIIGCGHDADVERMCGAIGEDLDWLGGHVA